MTKEYQKLVRWAREIEHSTNEDEVFKCWEQLILFLKEWECVPLGEDGVAVIEQVLSERDALADRYMHLVQIKKH